DTRVPRPRTSGVRSRTVLPVVPARRRHQLEQRAAAVRIVVGELGGLLVEADLELSLLDPVVEPRAAEDEALQPRQQLLALDEGERVPVANEIAAERGARHLDAVARHELDQVGRLVVVELVAPDQAELDGGRRHALGEVVGVEAEAIRQVLDDVVVPGVVVAGSLHGSKRTLASVRTLRVSAVVATIGVLVVGTALALGWPIERAVYLAPVLVVAFAALAGLLILWGKV